MPVRTIVEWHCARCGAEEAIEQHKPHNWRMAPQISRYQGNPTSASPEPLVSGDICQECAKSFFEWWQRVAR
jgi:hypothetical protein